jgi:hypothetical protein
MDEPDIADLLASIDQGAMERAIRAAYERGREKGREEVRDTVLKAFSQPVSIMSSHTRVEVEPSERDPEPAKRAPRGLTQQVVDEILGAAHEGLTLRDLVMYAEVCDPRVSSKTIYNILKLREDRYRLVGDRWFLLRPSPIYGQAAQEDNGEII